MKYSVIYDVISDKITGEWGNEPVNDSGVKIIRTANFTNLGIIDFSNIVLREIEPSKIEKKKLETGDVIIEKSGGSPTQPVGRVVFFENPDNSVYLCNNFTTVLRPNRLVIFPKFLFYVLFYNHQIKKTLRFQNKTTGIINLKLDKYLESKIPLPPLEDQIGIASLLSKAEALIAKRKESLSLLDEYLKSVFLDMFGDEKNQIFELTKLENVAVKITDGTHQSPKFLDEGVPFLLVSNIVKNQISFETKKFISESEYVNLNKRTPIEKGDLLFTSVGSYGNAALVKDNTKFAFQRHIAYIKPNKDVIDPIFLYGALMSDIVKMQVDRAVRGVAQKTLNLSELKMIQIPFPPLPLQKQFAEIVEKVEAMKETYSESLRELENLYGSLSQRAFKGELGVGN